MRAAREFNRQRTPVQSVSLSQKLKKISLAAAEAAYHEGFHDGDRLRSTPLDSEAGWRGSTVKAALESGDL